MDIINLAISLIAMIATVISTVIAVKAKNEVKRVASTINIGENNNGENSNSVINNAENSGVVSQTVSGGVKIGK